MATPLDISVNLRASQVGGRFYMGLDEALELYNGGLVEAIKLALSQLEVNVSYEQKALKEKQLIIKRAKDAIKASGISLFSLEQER
jgi:hypothetical protein